eukprot:TRINITY_DN50869_c0_g1_i2.p1 TRINITY_DN50869_c0_g1~~TRINITY_DN50869_c0_g1_i2.p1  ORF type:complete len:198 (-),score=28.01 TRINITY_DN50869_c0_g1_i2:373-966(-)
MAFKGEGKRGECVVVLVGYDCVVFFFQAEDGIRDVERSRGLGDVYKRQIERSLGKGTFGMIHIGMHLSTRKKIAVLNFRKGQLKEVEDIERVTREIHILRHPHIIQIFDIIKTPKELFLFTELADGGELFDYIAIKHRLEEREAFRIFQEMICGVEYLHQQCIVHRDLKLENLILNQNHPSKLLILAFQIHIEKGNH